MVFDETDAELKEQAGGVRRRDAPRPLPASRWFWCRTTTSSRRVSGCRSTSANRSHSGADGRPYLKAEADRDANRINITAKNVASLQLLLNDAIVDLDKEFTVVVNGKAVNEKRQRSLITLTEFVSFKLFDPNRVWTTTYSMAVPKADAGGAGGNGEK